MTESCGLCASLIEAGAPVLRITVPNVRRTLIRCVSCVGPAPPELPELVAIQAPEPVTMSSLQSVARTVGQDFKALASGNDP